MPDMEDNRPIPAPRRYTSRCHVRSARDLYRGFAVSRQLAALGAFAVEKTLNIGKERHKLAIMPLLEGVGIGAEFIIHYLPDKDSILLGKFPMMMDLCVCLQRQ